MTIFQGALEGNAIQRLVPALVNGGANTCMMEPRAIQ